MADQLDPDRAAVVTPVAKTGLHCGWLARVGALLCQALVTPVAKTGLHCGTPNDLVIADEAE